MVTMTIERTVRATPADAFAWLADAGNYTRSRVVLRSRLATLGAEAPYGTGAVRVLTWTIGWFRERIIAYRPPHHFDYLVERSFPPARHEGGRITFEPDGGDTRIVWTTTARLPVPVIGDWLTRTVARPIILRAFGTLLDTMSAELAGATPR